MGVVYKAEETRLGRQVTLLKERKSRYVSPVAIANLYVRLGDNEQAIAWLEKAYQEHAGDLRNLKTEPLYDPLRSDPRFQYLLRRIGFSP